MITGALDAVTEEDSRPGPDLAPQRPADRLLHYWRSGRVLLGIAGLYLAVRAVGLSWLQLVIIGRDADRYRGDEVRLIGALKSWDSGWFLGLAEKGYPSSATAGQDGAPDPVGAAFFPGYPTAVWAVHQVSRLSLVMSALLVSALAGTVAAVLIYRLVADLYRPLVGLLAVVLWAAQPMSVVENMAYSETLFTVFAVGALLAAWRRHWIAMGVLGFLAGFTRSQGLALAGALAIWAAWWWWRNGRPRAEGMQALAGVSLAAASAPLYIVMIGLRMGRMDAWFVAQDKGWGSRWDWGSTTWEQLDHEFLNTPDFYMAGAAFMVVAAVALLVVAATKQVWIGLLAYGALSLLQILGSSVFLQSRPRLFIPIVTLVVPVALALAKAKPVVRMLVLVLLVFFGFWYSAHSITVWGLGI